MVDPVAFFNLCTVKDEIKGPIPFEAWPHLISLLHVMECNRYISIGKAKKQGVSTFLGMRALWKVMTHMGWNHLFISAGERQGARQLLAPAKFAYMNLPQWIRDSCKPEKWSDTEISFPSMGSGIVVLPSSQAGAVGEAASEVDIDEHDFHQYPEEDWATAEATTSGGGKIVSSSTRWLADPENSVWLQTYLAAKRGENNFVPVFISCFSRPGFDEAWRENQRRNYSSIGGRMFEWNYPRTEDEMLKMIDASMFFDATAIKSNMEQAREPLETKYGFMHIYNRFISGTAYAIGADISQGVGSDYQTLVVIGRRNNIIEDIAYIHCNDLTIPTYATYSHELAQLYNFPLLGAEANAMGRSYVDELVNLKYRKIYYRDNDIRKLGWWTDKDRRDNALLDFAKAFESGQIIIRYKPVLQQMASFQKIAGRSGAIEYRSAGKHDDLVMAWAIAYQMLKEIPEPTKKNLQLVAVQSMRGMYG